MPLVKLADVRMDGGTQARAFMSAPTVNSYREAIQRGAQLPPVVVFYDGAVYWMADGFHRAVAAEHEGQTEIAADVREGTKRDAILYAVGANDAHGLPRNNADKRKAVQMLLDDEEWSLKSNYWIADICKVTEHLVRSMRPEPTATQSQLARIGKDGKTRALPKATSKRTTPTLAQIPNGVLSTSLPNRSNGESKALEEPTLSDISHPNSEPKEGAGLSWPAMNEEKPNSDDWEPSSGAEPTLRELCLELIENHVALLASTPEARHWFDRMVRAVDEDAKL